MVNMCEGRPLHGITCPGDAPHCPIQTGLNRGIGILHAVREKSRREIAQSSSILSF